MSRALQARSANRCKNSTRLRVALAVCASPSAALRTADRLMQAGVAAGDIAFGADEGRSHADLTRMLALMPEPRPMLVTAGGENAGQAAAAATLAKLPGPRRVLAGLDCLLTPDLVTAMKRHLMRGAVAVAVLVPSPHVEAAISEILLRASVDHVQFHDIA